MKNGMISAAEIITNMLLPEPDAGMGKRVREFLRHYKGEEI